jgi:AGZA family xanthine/uracil permease-like MFS transporter
MVASVNDAFETSVLGRYFCIAERKSCLTTEMRAGTVTFLTMAYILAVNAAILSDSGGNCSIADCSLAPGVPFCQFGPISGGGDPGYEACRSRSKKAMISATAAGSLISCFLMGAIANLPIALAPGMGINAYFTYTVVGFYGTGNLTYSEALAACFIEGWIFILLSVSGVRGKLIQLVPKAIMLSTAGGIGLFLAFIGMQGAEGLGLVTMEPATLVTLGGCPLEDRVYYVPIFDASSICLPDGSSPGLGPRTANYQCKTQGRLRSGSLWLGVAGGIIMVLCMGRNIRGAIMIGILFVTFISWIPNHQASYLGGLSQFPGGDTRLDYFREVVGVPDVSAIAVAWNWSAFGQSDLWAALITFLYLDFLDATGTLFSMATFLNRSLPGFIHPKTKQFPRQVWAFCIDGVATFVGALLGIAPLTCYIESATGIKEGGRTGVTVIMTAFWFFVALFFTPIIAAIPPYATGPALIFVGAIMMENLVDIDWEDVNQAVPAFLTISIIPLTYSIAYGVIAGVMSYIALYSIQICIEILMMPITKKTWADIKLMATPDAFLPDDEEEESKLPEDNEITTVKATPGV